MRLVQAEERASLTWPASERTCTASAGCIDDAPWEHTPLTVEYQILNMIPLHLIGVVGLLVAVVAGVRCSPVGWGGDATDQGALLRQHPNELPTFCNAGAHHCGCLCSLCPGDRVPGEPQAMDADGFAPAAQGTIICDEVAQMARVTCMTGLFTTLSQCQRHVTVYSFFRPSGNCGIFPPLCGCGGWRRTCALVGVG